ncbi:MAG: hypothetical protein ABII90_03610, partial [Bacteroidota bacterium]
MLNYILGSHHNPVAVIDTTKFYGKDVNACAYYVDGADVIPVSPTFPMPVNVIAGTITCDMDGIYDVVTNPDPDNIGIIGHQRTVLPAEPADVNQLIRATTGRPNADGLDPAVTAINALDVIPFTMVWNNAGGTWDRWRGDTNGSGYVVIRDGNNELNLVIIGSAFGATPVVMPIAGIYEAVPTTYADGDAVPFQCNELGEIRIAGYNAVDEVVSTEVTNQHSMSDTGIITFLNGVTATTTSAEYNSFMWSQWHILIKAVTGDVTGAGDIYLDASVDNTDWDTAILSQNIA